MEMFKNRKLLIATKHKKERVMAPILERELGVICFVDENFDTDELGTFTGEVERTLDPISTLQEKCLRAMRKNNCDLAIASEGSFGPHPSLFFVNADDELVMLLDTRHHLKIVERELSTDTNYNGREVRTEEELRAFADEIQFPSHGLILRKSASERIDIEKGITDQAHLLKTFHDLLLKYQTVYVETDMRAMYNPSRLKVIEQATIKLVNRMKSTYPQCDTPGFGVTDAKRGLECDVCGEPTQLVKSYVSVCSNCNYSVEQTVIPSTANAMYCNHCNP
ncbi:MAG: DUF6671 family protein [Cyclobacteriaceae bacterium]|jgi:hypothetical protein|nr:hypothetical protein [Flammeovirgaceae bacterium]